MAQPLSPTPHPASSPQPVVFKRYDGRVVTGKVLVLAAGTLVYHGPHPDNATISTPGQCQDACGALPWCNAWTFCNNAHGCDSGCSAFVAKHRTMNSPGMQPVNASLPITVFGPFNWPYVSNGCHYNLPADGSVGGHAGNTDQFPFGMCTLKEATDPARPGFDQLTPGAPGGWVSGTVARPKICQDLGAAVCTACLASADSAACLRCAWDDRGRHHSGLGYLLPGSSDLQLGCAACAALPASGRERKECLACLLQGKPCQQCVLGPQVFGPGPPSIGTCLACERRLGQAATGGCNACAQSTAPGRCLACMATFPFSWCPAGGAAAAPPSGSCQPLLSSTPCDTCANGARSQAAFDACVACFAGGRVNQYECGGCLAAPDAASQQRCYACTQRAHFASLSFYGCAQCWGQWQRPGGLDRCLACVESPATAQAAKQECAYCLGEYGPANTAAQQTCLACLQQPHADYAASCERWRRRK